MIDDDIVVGAAVLLAGADGVEALLESAPAADAARFGIGLGFSGGGALATGTGVSALIAVGVEGEDRAGAMLLKVAGVLSAGGSS